LTIDRRLRDHRSGNADVGRIRLAQAGDEVEQHHYGGECSDGGGGVSRAASGLKSGVHVRSPDVQLIQVAAAVLLLTMHAVSGCRAAGSTGMRRIVKTGG